MLFDTPLVLARLHRLRAAALLREYMTQPAELGAWPRFGGSRFERFAAHRNEPHEITAEDLLAVGFRAEPVSAAACWSLLQDESRRVSGLLAELPLDLDLTDAPSPLIAPGGPAAELWELVRGDGRRWGVSRSSASALLARKRPRLIPAWDSVVASVFGRATADDHWFELRELLRADRRALHDRLADLRDRAGISDAVSVLRVLDVVTWMEGAGVSSGADEDEGEEASGELS